ncbi:MAG: hypothetical protein H7323_09890 [Frankiales bacterium]|nr:hypothetical protein [Frankiales bacterium]
MRECTVKAIGFDEDVIPGREAQADRGRQLLVPLGRLGAARRHGPLRTDHPDVAALPVRA